MHRKIESNLQKMVFIVQEVHAFQADCVNDLVEPWGLVRTTLRDWPPSQYDYSYADDAGIVAN